MIAVEGFHEGGLVALLDDALEQCGNLTTGEAAYVLSRLEAYAATAEGRIEVARLIGDPTLKVAALVEDAGGQQPAALLGGLAAEGDAVLVIVQRRWEA